MAKQNEIADFGDIMALLAATGGKERVTLIGVCGFAAAGKTTLCRQITTALPDLAFHLNCDLFSALSYPERRRRIDLANASGNPTRIKAEENPRNWYDWKGISTAIRSLRQKRSFEWDRAWNNDNGLLNASYSISLPSSGPAVILCDCIYLLHEPVRRWFDLTLLVQASAQLVDERRRRRAEDEASAHHAQARRERFERPYFEEYASCVDYCIEPMTEA